MPDGAAGLQRSGVLARSPYAVTELRTSPSGIGLWSRLSVADSRVQDVHGMAVITGAGGDGRPPGRATTGRSSPSSSFGRRGGPPLLTALFDAWPALCRPPTIRDKSVTTRRFPQTDTNCSQRSPRYSPAWRQEVSHG